MQVFTARTCETYDIDYLCEDLKKQVDRNVTFGSRTMGIAVCDSTIDYRAVMKQLSELYSFDIYGATALAFIKIELPEDISVSFMIITGDEELVGSMALSEPLTAENKEQVVADTYKLAYERLGENPRMAITLQPFSTTVTAEHITDILDRASDHLPIYGAVSSNDLSCDVSGVFVNGEFYQDRLLVNLLGGGIRPVFSVATANLTIPDKKAVVTRADNNIVYNVGQDTFLQFMAKNGLVIEPSYILDSCIATYTSSPALVFDDAGHYKIRNIIGIDYDTGAVTFTGEMPEGCEVAIATLKRGDVIESSTKCFEELIAKIEKNTSGQYQYSTLFSTACGGRYLIMSGDTSTEGNFITNSPALQKLASCGFYAMGEICPTFVDENGKAHNRAFHTAVTLMAL